MTVDEKVLIDRLERAAMAYERMGKLTRDDQRTREMRKEAMAELAEARRALIATLEAAKPPPPEPAGDVREALAAAILWIEVLSRKNPSHRLLPQILQELNLALSAPASAKAAPGSGVLGCRWRTIDSAPKTGQRVLLAKIVGHPDHETALWWASIGQWDAKRDCWTDRVDRLVPPTHWLPCNGSGVALTAPPAPPQGETR